MGKYRVVGIKRDNFDIKVTIEYENGHMETYGYPLGAGYEETDLNGELRAVSCTLRKLKEKEERAAKFAADAIDIESENAKIKGRIFETENSEEIPGKKKIKEIDSKGEKIKDMNL